MAVNVQGTLNVLAAAARHGAQRFLHIGSCFEYGSKPEPITEEELLTPTALYGATKAAATLLVIERARSLNVPLVIARPFGMWGPGEGPHRLVPQIIAACVNREPLNLTACDVIRDYTYVEDMAANILALAQTPGIPPGTIVNMGSGQGIRLRDFVLSVARVLDGADLMRFGVLPHRPTEMPSLVADVTRMRELLGSRPATLLNEGVRRMMTGVQSAS
jgi:nucleoside-diphosphate-sugar epimerase